MSQSVYDTYYPVKSSSRMTLMWIPHQAKKKQMPTLYPFELI